VLNDAGKKYIHGLLKNKDDVKAFTGNMLSAHDLQ